MQYLQNIIKKLVANNVILTGCSAAEINEVEKFAKHKLPKSYLEFLATMGKDTDLDIRKYKLYNHSYVGFGGEHVFYPTILYLKGDLIDQFKEDGRTDLTLTDNDFVFFSSQGIVFAFFKLDEGDNPPVYGYEEAYEGTTFPKLTDSLVEFYEKYLSFAEDPFENLFL